jgi:polygalacturonase
MAFTRLTRTDTVANLVDFGAIPNNPGVAATNAMAFRSAFNAFGTGPKRVVIPAGTWYFEQIL